ncbi:E3 UFM1-protein ligase 1 homolog isoform X2 [Athalia rosae]|uniref:E3 UFM1-protein ligase 1 homolog isoform X2 n=1 Tax=Athalia rosae TaxID=37344 RepID=UPI002033B39C|nr:E3 UFM1-protein ligase 1 homolog isoform X2 [Athalia rosae]
MTAVDWDEVKRLAADFQKAQLSSTLQRLSERNCIEIVTRLLESKLIEVIFTTDDELQVSGGRINLAELAKILNVDLAQVSKAAADIERHDKSIKIVLGQLIDKTYVMKISGEINERLSQHGHIDVSQLTLNYDLPAEFLQSTVEKELGKTIFGRQDAQDLRMFYTEGYVARNRAKTRGALSAITRPTPISAVLGQCSVPERIFPSIVDNLQELRQIPGIVSGKQGNNGIYVPTIYSKGQSEWVDNFYKQNGYLEYDALFRLGLSDPQNFVKRHFVNEKLTMLDSVAVGSAVTDQVDANVEEAAATGSFVDIYPLLPSVFTPEDAEALLRDAIKRINTNIHIFANTVAISDAFLQSLLLPFENIVAKKAEAAVDSGKWLQYVAETRIKSKSIDNTVESKMDKREERRKKAVGGKAGGGSQGRETRTKSTKKKSHRGKSGHNNVDSDDAHEAQDSGRKEFVLLTIVDVANEIGKQESLSDIEGLVPELASHLQAGLNQRAMALAEQLAQTTKINNLSVVEERLNAIALNIRIFDKGIKQLDKTVQPSLTKYLLKTLGVDLVTELIKVAAQQNVVQCPDVITNEARQKIIAELPPDVREPLNLIHKVASSGASVDELLNAAEPALAACCMVLRKYDKKKERPAVVGHREALLEQLSVTRDPALVLHLTTSILFTAVTQTALHMSGRHVFSILDFLLPYIQQDVRASLRAYHDLVLMVLSSADADAKQKVQWLLDRDLEDIKNIAINFKKQLKSDKPQDGNA